MFSFQSTIIKLKVSKKPDKRHEELLISDSKNSDDGGLWNSITSTLTGKCVNIRTLRGPFEKVTIIQQ